jgi:hypothetical protein
MDLAATRFIAVRWLVLFTAGDLQAARLDLWDTGVAPHFDVVHADLGELVARMLGTALRDRRLSDADDRSASRSQR